jgi:hypothetical protein
MANSTTHLTTVAQNQAYKEVTVNGLFDAASQALTYGRNEAACIGLSWSYYGGRVTLADGTTDNIANGAITLDASTTVYLVASKATGAVSSSTSTTNWNATGSYWRLYSVVTGTASVTSWTDYREMARYTGGDASGGIPITKTTAFTLAANENFVICNGSGSITVTLPAASAQPGRDITIKTIAAQTVVSASSNVCPITSATAGTAILAATAGKWARLVSDGTNWVIMSAG